MPSPAPAAALAIPANLTGLALIQCRMIAAVAHLHGYDLADPRVHNAILALLLGEDDVERLVKKRKLPTTPMAMATAPVFDPHLDVIIASEVAAELIAKVAGKRLATTIGRRVPVVGGLVGMSADAPGPTAHSTRLLGAARDGERYPYVGAAEQRLRRQARSRPVVGRARRRSAP